MKRTLLIILLLSTCFLSCKTQEDKIKAVVNRWNELHNQDDAEGFITIYGDDVLFYGKQTSGQQCYDRKKAFLNGSFRQDIISPITLTYYSSGTIKADFTKRTRFRSAKVREYYCYLLINKKAGDYKITGESDLLSDQKRNTQLQLGTVVLKPAGRNRMLLLISLLLIIAAVVYWQIHKRKKGKEWREFEELYKAAPEPVAATAEHTAVVDVEEDKLMQKIKAAVREQMQPQHSEEHDSIKKGRLFENYVVEKFDDTYFKLREWRSDKYHNGRYASASLYPDMEYHFHTNWYNINFAVECKWRAEFNQGKIEWAKERQRKTYEEYARKNRIPVFVIIGVGGQPSNPEAVYIIPLLDIRYDTLTEKWLKKYLRYSKNNFFLNTVTMTLE